MFVEYRERTFEGVFHWIPITFQKIKHEAEKLRVEKTAAAHT